MKYFQNLRLKKQVECSLIWISTHSSGSTTRKLSGVEEGCCLENLPTSQDSLSLIYFQNWGLLAGFVAAACQNVCGGPCPSPSPSKSWQFESLSLSYLNLPQWGWGDGAGSLTLPSLPPYLNIAAAAGVTNKWFWNSNKIIPVSEQQSFN